MRARGAGAAIPNCERPFEKLTTAEDTGTAQAVNALPSAPGLTGSLPANELSDRPACDPSACPLGVAETHRSQTCLDVRKPARLL